jgi:hypothetical protein
MPDANQALVLVKHWSLIRIGGTTSGVFEQWRISTKEFREDLEWAISVETDTEISSAVIGLLAELSARGIRTLSVRVR